MHKKSTPNRQIFVLASKFYTSRSDFDRLKVNFATSGQIFDLNLVNFAAPGSIFDPQIGQFWPSQGRFLAGPRSIFAPAQNFMAPGSIFDPPKANFCRSKVRFLTQNRSIFASRGRFFDPPRAQNLTPVFTTFWLLSLFGIFVDFEYFWTFSKIPTYSPKVKNMPIQICSKTPK